MPSIRRAAGQSLLALGCILPIHSLAAQPAANDSGFRATIEEARGSFARGSVYLASRLLVPVLGTRTGREPEVLLLAAQAAGGWQGWGTVQQLLFGEPWLDRFGGGEGRALLARARLERSELATEDAQRAVASASPGSLGGRLVLLARAYDRGEQRDSAAQLYRRAATELPIMADWLLLRAAGVTRDSIERAALYRGLTLPAATGRIPWTEALARSRIGEYLGSARVYAALGAQMASLRMRARAASSDAARGAVRRDLFTLISAGTSGEVREAIILLDSMFAPLTAREDLQVARRAAATDLARAAAGFAHAGTARLLTETDRLSQASVLARLGAHREAMRILLLIRSRDLRAQAEYHRARSLLALGDRSGAIEVLQQIAGGPVRAGDSATAALAGFLGADLLVDDGDDAAARRLYLDVARRFPHTAHGPRAAFQAAMIAWTSGDRVQAGREFSALADSAGEHGGGEAAAALYWSGRALATAGDSGAARERWVALLERFPGSYYAIRAAERLGTVDTRAPTQFEPGISDSTLAPAFERAVLLERLGLRVEAGFEYDRLARVAAGTGTRLSAAAAFLERGLVGRAYRLAQPLGDSVTRRFTFPLSEIPFLVDEAARAQVDPMLAAAIMRQESGFELTARSRAGALGWMQVMPAVGAILARGSGIREWDAGLLHQPEINLRFGLSHLVEILERHTELPIALAAYNAGARAAGFWRTLPGAAADLDVFIERIQYAETRDYVRAVLRNLAVYRALYPKTQ